MLLLVGFHDNTFYDLIQAIDRNALQDGAEGKAHGIALEAYL